MELFLGGGGGDFLFEDDLEDGVTSAGALIGRSRARSSDVVSGGDQMQHVVHILDQLFRQPNHLPQPRKKIMK